MIDMTPEMKAREEGRKNMESALDFMRSHQEHITELAREGIRRGAIKSVDDFTAGIQFGVVLTIEHQNKKLTLVESVPGSGAV